MVKNIKSMASKKVWKLPILIFLSSSTFLLFFAFFLLLSFLEVLSYKDQLIEKQIQLAFYYPHSLREPTEAFLIISTFLF